VALGKGLRETREMKTRELPKIGVVLCYCGDELRVALDFETIEKHARTLPGVVYVKAEAHPCSRPGLARLKRAIKENGLERVAIAGCTPRIHGKLLARACESAGLNKWFIDIANIREHCSRVHGDKVRATEKAMDLIGVSVRKLSMAKPYEAVRVKPESSVLVIGGGITGLTAAASLAGLNHEVTLIEKGDRLGGTLLKLLRPYPHGRTAGDIITDAISATKGKVKVLTQTEIVSLSGAPGQYLMGLSTNGKIEEHKFGALVVASGAELVGQEEVLREPVLTGISAFSGRILTEIDLEQQALSAEFEAARSVLFVSIPMPEQSNHGLRVYSLVALRNAANLKEACPDLEIWLLFKDIPFDLEREFRRARDAGVKFVRLESGDVLEFVKHGVKLRAPTASGRDVEVKVDAIVLPTLFRPAQSSHELAKVLRIQADAHGFFVEPHIKLWPGEFAERGIFVAGTCHSPTTILEAAAQAVAVASRAARFLSRELFRAPLKSIIDRKVCRGCSRCAMECRWDAIRMVTLENGLKLALVDDVLCTGCGVCSTVCINGAPSLAPVTQRQISAMLEVAGGRT